VHRGVAAWHDCASFVVCFRDYPEAPLQEALREAGRYGLYDLNRIETMILRNIRHDYFPRRNFDDDDQE